MHSGTISAHARPSPCVDELNNCGRPMSTSSVHGTGDGDTVGASDGVWVGMCEGE